MASISSLNHQLNRHPGHRVPRAREPRRDGRPLRAVGLAAALLHPRRGQNPEPGAARGQQLLPEPRRRHGALVHRAQRRVRLLRHTEVRPRLELHPRHFPTYGMVLFPHPSTSVQSYSLGFESVMDALKAV